MGLINFVTTNSGVIAILLVMGFIAYQFFVKPGTKVDGEPAPEQFKPDKDDKDNPGEKESVTKRMGRGFKVMKDKIESSEFVKNVQAEQEDYDPDEFLPTGIKQTKNKKKTKNEEDIFTTKIGNWENL